MSTTAPNPHRCDLCGVALSPHANTEAHQRTRLCLSTRLTTALRGDGYLTAPEDRQVSFLLTASVGNLARVEDTALIPREPRLFAHGPYAERWWPAWAVELAVALATARLRKMSSYPERLRVLAAAPEAVRESALTTLRAAGAEALDALLFRPATASEVPRG